MPLGVAPIVYAAQVNSKWAMGDLAGAHAASASARKFAIWSAVGAFALFGVYLIGAGLFLALMAGHAGTAVPTPAVTSL